MATHAPAPAAVPPPVRPSNGLAITSLVLGLIGVFLGLFAGLTWMAVVPLGILALTFGLIGLSRKRKGAATAGTMAGFGTLLGAISLALGIWGIVIFSQGMQELDKAFDDFDKQLSQELNAPPPADPVQSAPGDTHRVVYRVAGTDSASITYSTDGMGSSSQANGESLPWSQTERIKDDGLNAYSLMAQNEGSGKISCSITVDGKKVVTESSTGPYAVVMCTTP